MDDSFELLTSGVTRIYKSIQKIKRLHMDPIGLKGTHVMCIHYLYTHPEASPAQSSVQNAEKTRPVSPAFCLIWKHPV